MRLLDGSNKELREGEAKGTVKPVVIRKCDARSSMNSTSLCAMKPSKWNEIFPPRTRVPCPRWSAASWRRWNSRASMNWS